MQLTHNAIIGKAGLALALLTVGGLTAAPAHAGNLRTNGSFEAGNFVDGGLGYDFLPAGSTAMTGWTTYSSELAWGQNGNVDGLTASDGSFFLDLTGSHNSSPYGGVTQTINTMSGQQYALSFDLGVDQSNGSLAGPISVDASGGDTTHSFTFNPSGSGIQWGTFGYDFTATGSSTQISILGTSGIDYIGLDNVSVTPVPEASTLVSTSLLLCLGLGGLAVSVRRRKGRSAE